jgi:transcriptional regulator with XRE-family HTH domain
MDDKATALALAIGARAKQERVARGWTLEQLAGAAGVSRRAVINVEQGTANPSVATLLRLSDALGIGLPALVAPPAPASLTVTRAGEGAVLWTGTGGGRGVLVAGTEPPDVVELWDWTLAPGDRHDSEPHATGTKELLQVRAGAVTVEVHDQEVTVQVGDAVSFPGDLTHSYANHGSDEAWFSLAVFEPGVGTTNATGATHD